MRYINSHPFGKGVDPAKDTRSVAKAWDREYRNLVPSQSLNFDRHSIPKDRVYIFVASESQHPACNHSNSVLLRVPLDAAVVS